MSILSTINLVKNYGKGETAVNALKDCNLSIENGEMVAIIGESGSGKSTLLHLLGGLDRPTAGKVIIDGENIYSLKEDDLAIFRRRKIGFVFQYYNLIPLLSAEENIIFPLLIDGKKVDVEYINDLIELLGLSKRRNHLPSSLSGGQQQRVALARAMANKPLFILADEPTGNLDSRTTDEVMHLLRLSVKKYHQTLIMITHNERLLPSFDRIINISDGEISEGKVSQI